jgi:hypothetical protein
MRSGGSPPGSTVTETSRERLWRRLGQRLDNRLLAFSLVALYGILAVGSLPVLLLEQNRDWETFALAGRNLKAGAPLYFDATGELTNLYPPAMALLWTLPLSGPAWFALAAATIAVIGVLARGRERLLVVGLVAMLPPLHYDLLTGNVTTFYVAALALVLARPGWLGAAPLGIVLAIAAKPALVPFVILLALSRPGIALRVATVTLLVTGLAVLIAGVDRHLEYAAALLDSQRQFAAWTTGNVGLARLGPLAVAMGLAGGLAATLAAARFVRWEHAVAIALGAGALTQPTLGFYYAALLVPGVVLMWRVDRVAAALAALSLPVLSILSPVVGGMVLITLAAISPLARRVSNPADVRAASSAAIGPAGRVGS